MRREALFILVLALIFMALDSCASRVSSSTDNHHRVPVVDCNMIKFEGHMQEICCENDHCVLTE